MGIFSIGKKDEEKDEKKDKKAEDKCTIDVSKYSDRVLRGQMKSAKGAYKKALEDEMGKRK